MLVFVQSNLISVFGFARADVNELHRRRTLQNQRSFSPRSSSFEYRRIIKGLFPHVLRPLNIEESIHKNTVFQYTEEHCFSVFLYMNFSI